jgi:hypothetical protein
LAIFRVELGAVGVFFVAKGRSCVACASLSDGYNLLVRRPIEEVRKRIL